jgi:hypothetical protein
MVLIRSELSHAKEFHLAGALRCHWNNRKYGADTVGVITHQRISPKIVGSLIARLQKCSPALFRTEKFLKNIDQKRRQIISSVGRPHVSSRPWCGRRYLSGGQYWPKRINMELSQIAI